MKIWLRIGKPNLTAGGRTLFGIAISHDGVRDAFNDAGVECLDEYPVGDANTAERVVPESRLEYLTMWYGDPRLWDISVEPQGRGVVGYTRCGETPWPQSIIDPLNLCDVVFVASTTAQKCFAEQLDPPVHVLSGGIKPELFPYIERDYGGLFTFFHVGAHWRKGTDVACEGFAKAFPTEQNVRLVVMGMAKTEMFAELERKYKDDCRVEFIEKAIFDRGSMAEEYYGQGHCLVYPSIMEGWGRCLAEGMSTGMPVLCFRASSMLDQFHEDCGWWVEAGEERHHMYPLPSVDDLAFKMRIAFENRAECYQRGLAARSRALSELTWDIGIRAAMPILERIYQGGSHEDSADH